MAGFSIYGALGFALGFLFGVGCASAVLYTIYLAGYRRALRDSAERGAASRFRKEIKRLRYPSKV